MKKKIVLFLIITFCFLVQKNNVFALRYQAVLTGNQVSLRTGPGTNYGTTTFLYIGEVYDLVTNEIFPSEKDCQTGWYKLKYSTEILGYACADFITVNTLEDENPEANNECEQALIDLGFPSSYLNDLCSLKQRHPSWSFYPIITGLDWPTVVRQESSCNKSYIASTNAEYIDYSCTNPYSKTWYPASAKAVAFYMDPRNWFKETAIFQFEKLSYAESLKDSYPGAIATVLRPADFYNFHVQNGTNFSEVLNNVGRDSNVNPVFLSSRILQELGNGTTLYNLYSGQYPGEYLGYYNFYNIGISDTCATTYGTTYCGLSYAASKGWNSVYNALKGGADFLSGSYIAVGQDSIYLQKYNVAPKDINQLYGHQYMTNVAAPSSEARTIYNSKVASGLLDLPYAFYIPVYENMNAQINNENSGAIPDNNPPIVPSNTDINILVTTAGYKYASPYLLDVKDETSILQITNAFASIGAIVKVKNQHGLFVTSGNLATGYTVNIANANKEENLTVVIKGDPSSDGVINALDLLQVQKSILGTYTLSDLQLKAADTSGDNIVNALDLLHIQKNILGTYKINN